MKSWRATIYWVEVDGCGLVSHSTKWFLRDISYIPERVKKVLWELSEEAEKRSFWLWLCRKEPRTKNPRRGCNWASKPSCRERQEDIPECCPTIRRCGINSAKHQWGWLPAEDPVACTREPAKVRQVKMLLRLHTNLSPKRRLLTRIHNVCMRRLCMQPVVIVNNCNFPYFSNFFVFKHMFFIVMLHLKLCPFQTCWSKEFWSVFSHWNYFDSNLLVSQLQGCIVYSRDQLIMLKDWPYYLSRETSHGTWLLATQGYLPHLGKRYSWVLNVFA